MIILAQSHRWRHCIVDDIADNDSVRAMHRYRKPAASSSYPPPSDTVFDGDEELADSSRDELVPYAHRDIKPGFVAGIRVARSS